MKTLSNTRKLVECALLIAVGTVLSLAKIVDMPYGGSVTLASMLPVILISYRHGLGWGMGSGVAYAVVQQLLGLKSLSYVTTWQSILAVILLDYIVAFAVCGLGGIFRKCLKNQSVALVCGSLFVSVLRYLCHVISGATVWAGISIPTQAAIAYSLVYNATYMVPEAIVLVLVAYYIGSMIDFTKDLPVRLKREDSDPTADMLAAFSGLAVLTALIADVAMIFGHMQDPDTGRFNIELLKVESYAESFWLVVTIVTAIAAVAVAVMLTLRYFLLKKKNTEEK